jgi:non-ribosomal peptide synthetase-like protein
MIPSESTGEPPTPSVSSINCLHELFEFQATQQPQYPAIIYQSQVISYGEVEIRSNQLAHFLKAQGVDCGAKVALLLPRSPELYISILGILKAGAAYVPLDPEYPSDRIEYILSDCATQAIITHSNLAHSKGLGTNNVVALDLCSDKIALESKDRLAEIGVGERDLSYIIYTSGSTGRPKGVEIEHRSSRNYIQVVNETVYQVTPEDRVYQGFSIAFDASVEEVWCTFAAGAALVVGSVEQVRSGVDLAHFLTEQGVTVLSCVPTLLAMMEKEVPRIRLLILGGEQCPQELAARWCNDRRRVVNTYGPTEATVVSTWHECHPDRPITIGKPLPTYQVYILDEDLEPVKGSEAGEIYIGGICLARGYVNRPELTAEKFIPNPLTFDPTTSDRLYKSGDLGCWTADGEIQFLGRIDGQVKLRGFRIELAEIESVIMQCTGVSAAVVAVKSVVGIDRLIAYVVPKLGLELDLPAIWTMLRDRLPIYMVPGSIEMLTDLPTLPSGKVDRKSLPEPMNFGAGLPTEGITPPKNPVEAEIALAWATLFGVPRISIHHDFFNELGGHSLLAAMMVSKLREHPQFQDLAVLDVYEHPTVAKLAAALQARWQQRGDREQDVERSVPAKSFGSSIKGLWASIGVYLMYVLYSLPLLIPGYFYYDLTDEEEESRVFAAAVSSLMVIAVYPTLVLLSIPIKWLVIGRFRPGRYPLWSFYYWRFWLVRQVQSLIPLWLLTGSPLMNWYCRLMGAKIGKDVYLNTNEFLAFDLLTIGNGSSIGAGSGLAGYEVVDGWLRIGTISLGDNCYVGSNTVLGLNSRLADGAEIGDLSYLLEQQVIPAGEHWAGSPARLQPSAITVPPSPAPAAPSLLWLGYLLGIVGQLLLPAISALPSFLLWVVLIESETWYLWLLPFALLGSTCFIGVFCLQVVFLKSLLLKKIRPGTYALRSSFGLRHWFLSRLMELSLGVMPTLYSTLYLLPWLRLLGAKIGPRAEISTASNFTPDLISIGAESFIADGVSIGASQVKQGWIQLAPTQIGKQAFIGNGSLVPSNTQIADSCLIGCLSVPPIDGALIQPNSAWMGSPAIQIPHRQVIDNYGAEQTYKPAAHLYWLRLLIEYFRVVLPGSIHFVVLLGMETTMLYLPSELEDDWRWIVMGLLFPVIYAMALIGSVVFIIILKWLVVGRYQPGNIPLWNNFVWRTELITGLYESIVVAGCLHFFLGTPFAAIILRLLGMKIGKGVYIDTTDFTEFDLISIGNNVVLNNKCTLQTHLFEDRVMKMDRIRLEPRCQMGSGALVLYDTRLESDVRLYPMSLIMKGEQVPQATGWQGMPASRFYGS